MNKDNPRHIRRTQYLQLAAILAVIVTTIAVFLTGWFEPRGVLGGLFDFLTIPLWLGSLYISLRNLTAISAGEARDFNQDELLLLQGLADQAALAVVNTTL